MESPQEHHSLQGARSEWTGDMPRIAAQILLDLASDAILLCDEPNLRIVCANRSAGLLMDCSPTSLRGRLLANVLNGFESIGFSGESHILNSEAEPPFWNGMIVDGTGAPIRLEARARLIVAESGARLMAVTLTHAEANVEKANRQSSIPRDELTGLLTREGLRVSYERLCAQHSPPEGIAVLFIDLNGFKQINDAHGHHVGDAVLRQVAARLVKSMRPHDLVARHGGDEFVIIAGDVPQEEVAARIAARVGHAIRQPIACDSATASISASIGLAFATGATDSIDTLVQQADAAMYREKRALGRPS